MEEIRLATEAMGTRFEAVLFGPDPGRLRAAGDAAMGVIEETHQLLSRFEPASLLSHLHRIGPARPTQLDHDTFALFADARAVRLASGGGFDITRGSGGADGGFVLDPEAVTIRLTSPRVRLDLGGIAKGHGLDLAARAIRESGVDSAFVHGGTSSGVAIGRPPGGTGWRVALGSTPDSPVLALVDAAFSVSAALRTAATGDVLEPHVLDPESGEYLSQARRVAAVGPSARLADAWTTALLVLGTRPTTLGTEWRLWIHEDAGPWHGLLPEPMRALHGAA